MPIHGNWQKLGIQEQYLQDQFPDIAGKFSGLLIVVASAACVWKDLEAAGMAKNHDAHIHVMAVNDMLMHYPGKVTHAYSNDHRWLPKWIAARREQLIRAYGGIDYVHTCHHGAKYSWPWPGHGTSSLNAVYTGLALGYDEIWICGAPMDNGPHYFDAPWAETNFGNLKREDGSLPYWTNAARSIFEGRVKSFSGRTREVLGAPNDQEQT